MKSCTTCGRSLPTEAFYKKLDGTTPRCRECTKAIRKSAASRAKAREYQKVWRQRNPERVAISNKVYQKAHPEKFAGYSRRYYARTGGQPAEARGQWAGQPLHLTSGRYFETTERDLSRLRFRQGGRCAACDSSLADGEHLDHIVPLIRGGRHSIGNIQFLCPTCNLRKHDRLFADFRRDLKEVA